jgi:predicted membrane channel-forming protein YqfA (hemolysin III family)
MFLRIWRFITITLTALLMGATFCHVLEWPAKMRYPADLYLTLHRTLYVAFGPPNIGAFIEIGAILAAVALALLTRKRRPAFRLTLAGAAFLVTGLVVYFVFVEPANVAMKAMSLNAPPAGWTQWRDQWEYGHIAHFIFHLLGFSALALSIILESSVAHLNIRPASATRKLRGPLGPYWRPER